MGGEAKVSKEGRKRKVVENDMKHYFRKVQNLGTTMLNGNIAEGAEKDDPLGKKETETEASGHILSERDHLDTLQNETAEDKENGARSTNVSEEQKKHQAENTTLNSPENASQNRSQNCSQEKNALNIQGPKQSTQIKANYTENQHDHQTQSTVQKKVTFTYPDQKIDLFDPNHWMQVWGPSWYEALKGVLHENYFRRCIEAVRSQRVQKKVFPPENLVFNAFQTTPLEKVKVVIVGQDPYHQPGQAMGLSFSVPKGVTIPPSLRNMFKELGFKSTHGDLTSWAKQGVFLLNAALTVVHGAPMAHKDLGWETFTNKTIQVINDECRGVVFLLWGAFAQKKGGKVDEKKHFLLTCGHPSPLSQKYFMGCDHFNKCNQILKDQGKTPIDWNIPQDI